MAKKALLTVDGTYRKVKKGLFTLDSVYRKVKKAYLTVGGVYRPCWAGGVPVYYGAATPLSAARYNIQVMNTPSYMIAAGGRLLSGSPNAVNTADAYDATLTRKTANALGSKMYDAARGSVGEYGIVAGGYNNSDGFITNAYVYQDDLTLSTLAFFRCDVAGSAENKNYFIVAGGQRSAPYSSDVTTFDSELTRGTATSLSSAVRYPGGGKLNKDYAFVVGGSLENGMSQDVAAYSASLTKQALASLTTGRRSACVGKVGNYNLVAGGSSSAGNLSSVEVYDQDFVKTTSISLSVANASTATTLGDYCMITGYGLADYYDENLTRTTLDGSMLPDANRGGSVGDFTVCVGGISGSVAVNSVHAFTLA